MSPQQATGAGDEDAGECLSCGEVDTPCVKSKRKCGHHCNHSWSHDECCWCGNEFTSDEEGTP